MTKLTDDLLASMKSATDPQNAKSLRGLCPGMDQINEAINREAVRPRKGVKTMKTQKDKIIELLKELAEAIHLFTKGDPQEDYYIDNIATRIQSETRTLSEEDKEQLELDIHNSIQPHAITFDRGEIAVKMVMDDVLDYLSLAIPEQPAMSEGEIADLQQEFLLKFTTWRMDEYEDSSRMNERVRPIEILEWMSAALSQTKKKPR